MAGNNSHFQNENGSVNIPFTVQNEAERRQIRQGYRKLMDDIREQKPTLIDPSDSGLHQKLNLVEKLFNQVKQPREGTLDSSSLVQLADLGKKKAQALQTDFVRFQPYDFCERLKVAMGGELDSAGLSANEWQRFGKAVQPMFYKTPILKFMCGSFERGDVCLRKARAQRGRELDTTQGKATQPRQLSTLEEAGRGELTTAHVENLLNTLWALYEGEDKGPLDFFEFVTHPDSFGQTVENIFYASFLVRDGHAKVSLDDEQLPVIEPIEKQELEISDETLSKNQIILNITPQKWKEIVTTFKIGKPLIQPVKFQTSG